MDQPIDYSLHVQQPFQSLVQGYQLASGIQADQRQQQAQDMQLAQQQRQQQFLQTFLTKPNKTATDYSDAMVAVPQIAAQLKQSWDTRSSDQQQAHLSDLATTFAALQSGNPDIAADRLDSRAQAAKNSGAPAAQVSALQAQAQLLRDHPEFARSMVGLMLASVPGGDKVLAGAGTLAQQQRDQSLFPSRLAKSEADASTAQTGAAVAPDKAAYDLANVRSQINDRAQRLGLDRDRLTSETQTKLAELAQKNGQVPEFVAKNIDSAVTDSIAAGQSAQRMTGLATQIERASSQLGSGTTARIGELWKSTFGTQNELTRLRAEYNRIVTPAAMAAYKQVASGSTSDKDIDTAMTGVPKDTDSPERMAQFLRGAAKLQAYDSVLANAKSEWLGAVRTLGKAPTDIEIDGVRVPAGTTFKAFSDRYVAQKAAQQIGAMTVAGRSYMRFAQPPDPGRQPNATPGATGGY